MGRYALIFQPAMALLALGSAQFLPPKPNTVTADPFHPTCSFAISQRVRKHIEEDILKPAALAGIEGWPAGCPFDPSRDLFQDWWQITDGSKNKTVTIGGICLADYCTVFGVCGSGEEAQQEELEQCDSTSIAKARQQCDTAVARCFPLKNGAVTRRLHAQYSRQKCQVLDCNVLRERQRGHEAAPHSLAALLAVVAPLLAAGLAGLVLWVDGSDQVLQLLVDSGAASTGVARGCLQAREALRGLAGFERTKFG
uniref:Uncharacterized protein n=1 Tax=Alexandrium catenella TaxID=2925 RepID=A0A7S1SA24_ALECA